MKHTIFLLGLILCLTHVRASDGITHILGKTMGLNGQKIFMEYISDPVVGKYRTAQITVNRAGEFDAPMAIKGSTVAHLLVNGHRITLYLEEGKNLGVFFDGNDPFSSMMFFEKENKENNLALQKFIRDFGFPTYKDGVFIQPSLAIDPQVYQALESRNADGRFASFVAFHQEEIKALERAKSTKNLSDAFYRFMTLRSLYQNMAYMVEFVDENELSNENYQKWIGTYFTSENVNNPDAVDNHFYLGFLDGLGKKRAQQQSGRELDYKTDFGDFHSALTGMGELSGAVKEYAMGRLLNYYFHPKFIHMVEAEYQNFLGTCTTAAIKTTLEKNYATANRFTEGTAAPDFRLMDANGNFVSLSQYRGKLVHVAFWAKWCRNCISEMDAAKGNLEELSKDDDVVFLFISLDKRQSDWKSHRVPKEVRGTHIWGGNSEQDLRRDFGIISLPKHFMIDRNGRFVGSLPKMDASGFVEYVRSL